MVLVQQGLLALAAEAQAGATSAREEPSAYREAASRAAIVRDWMLQDYMRVELPPDLEKAKSEWRAKYLRSPESRFDDPVLAKLACFVSPRDSIVEQRMAARVLAECGAAKDSLGAEVDRLVQARVPGSDPRWEGLYLRACEARRSQRLKPLLDRWRRFVFSQHQYVDHSWKYTELLSDAQVNHQRFFKPGGMLGVLDFDGIFGRVHTLIEDQTGILRDPDVSFDGTRVLFAWKKSDRGDDFHLYEMDVSSKTIRQITSGLGAADYEGAYLPDGNIVFSSTRCCQTVDCNWVDVSNLYVADGDGHVLRRVGFDQVHTIFPTVADDGRVLYTRWEYNDRGQIYPQALFQMNPDGTGQQSVYGNNSWFPTNIIHARKVPGSRKVLAVVTGHHRPAQGKVALLDPAAGREEGLGLELIAPVRKADYVQVDRYALEGNQFQYPYPISEDHFLVTMALPTPAGAVGRFDIYLMDRHGRRELLVEGQSARGIGCKQILPLAPRPRPHSRPSLAVSQKNTGTFYVQDVYQGLGLAGIPRGTIQQLRVVALDFRAAAIGSLSQQGRGGSSEVTTPVAVGNGSWDVKVVLGDARVYDDGSAMFHAPARTPLYFQALDGKGRAVQTMRSWTTLMPGEAQSCVGCHEHKNSTPRSALGVSLAMRAGPQNLTPFFGPPRGFSFNREIQPILDRHCVRCHTGQPDKPLNLTADQVLVGTTKRKFSQAYLTLTHAKKDCGDWNHPLVNWIDSMSEPELLPPRYRGSATSKLMALLEQGHEDVKLGQEELRKIACWIDLLVPYCGDYLEANGWSQEELDLYGRALAKRQRLQAIENGRPGANGASRAGQQAAPARRG